MKKGATETLAMGISVTNARKALLLAAENWVRARIPEARKVLEQAANDFAKSLKRARDKRDAWKAKNRLGEKPGHNYAHYEHSETFDMPSKVTRMCIGWVRVDAGTGAVLNNAQRGSVTPGRTGAGVYTLTLGQGGCNVAECEIVLGIETAAIDDNPIITHTSDTVKTIETFDGGIATDCQFTASIWQILGG
jgi:hypothetical protein